ncbi:hypothetical protein ACFONN_09925 [Dyella humi]|uniref:Uncharacterized protein n=1 Tax=Dyella humi TaxID=1770547 RepID=A0ABW8ICV5_9GAMM
MNTPSNRVIATRRLAYAYKDDPTRRAFTVRIHEPHLLTKGSVDFNFAEGTASCVISFDGLQEKEMTVHEADAIHALELAVQDIEHYLR